MIPTLCNITVGSYNSNSVFNFFAECQILAGFCVGQGELYLHNSEKQE